MRNHVPMTMEEFKMEMNKLGHDKVPFLFVVDFELEKPVLIKLSDVDPDKILFDVNGFTNGKGNRGMPEKISLETLPIPAEAYQKKFDRVFHRLEYGDSFLVNLTIRTEVRTPRTLTDIFFQSKAKYKLRFNDQFLVFSPETFIQLKNGQVFCYPMKGTIDASIANARERILEDRKELSEHVTIVDLIRNDLSQIATDVNVTRFRYIDEIQTDSKTLLQVSSEIVGKYKQDGALGLGDILVRLLPAGSVSGAPKPKTLEIIREVEGEKRGYYTGVFGIFDGENLDSGVMIRFIEQQNGKYYYRSGGGITTQSNAASEYREAIDKVYVPLT